MLSPPVARAWDLPPTLHWESLIGFLEINLRVWEPSCECPPPPPHNWTCNWLVYTEPPATTSPLAWFPPPDSWSASCVWSALVSCVFCAYLPPSRSCASGLSCDLTSVTGLRKVVYLQLRKVVYLQFVQFFSHCVDRNDHFQADYTLDQKRSCRKWTPKNDSLI